MRLTPGMFIFAQLIIFRIMRFLRINKCMFVNEKFTEYTVRVDSANV